MNVAPWNFDTRNPTTAAQSIREQDVLAASDALAASVLDFETLECLACDGKKDCGTCAWKKLGELAEKYQNEREGRVKK